MASKTTSRQADKNSPTMLTENPGPGATQAVQHIFRHLQARGETIIIYDNKVENRQDGKGKTDGI